MQHSVNFKHLWTFEALRPNGTLKWRHFVENDVVNSGLDDMLSHYWKGSGYTARHYIGLTDGNPTVAASDIMAAHPGWNEITAYSQETRPELVLGPVADQSVDNGASKASFTLSASSTIMGGAFIATDNTKGGASGTLIAVAPFTVGNKTLDTNDLLNVEVALTASNG